MDKPTIKWGKEIFFNLVNECKSKDNLRSVVNILDGIYRDDRLNFSEEDWPKLSKLVADVKARIEASESLVVY